MNEKHDPRYDPGPYNEMGAFGRISPPATEAGWILRISTLFMLCGLFSVIFPRAGRSRRQRS